MAYCAVCGEHDGLTNKCNHCGRKHCKDHTLPENHRCPGLRAESLSVTTENVTLRGEEASADEKSRRSSPATPTEPPTNEAEGSTKLTTGPTDHSEDQGGEGKGDEDQGDEAKGGEVQGDDSPPVSTKTRGSNRTRRTSLSNRATSERIKSIVSGSLYGFFYRFGEILTDAFWLVIGSFAMAIGFAISKRGLALLFVLTISIGAYSALVGTGIAPIDDTVDGAVDSGISIASDVSSGITNATTIDEERTEQLIHERINAVRDDRGLRNLSYDENLEEVAQYHSESMFEQGFFDHDSPSGGTMEDRYQRFGYNCRVSTGGNRYVQGAENIFHISGDFSKSESTLAQQAVESWMNSPGHRQNIVRPYWRREAIGIHVASKNGESHAYITQNFC